MIKTIEEIKDQEACKDGYYRWGDVEERINSRNISVKQINYLINQVSKRYAQSQTQYLIKSLGAKQGQINRLIKKYDRLEIDFKSQTQELQEQNAELVANIQLLLQSLDYDALGVMSELIIEDLKELLTKYNHLNKKP